MPPLHLQTSVRCWTVTCCAAARTMPRSSWTFDERAPEASVHHHAAGLTTKLHGIAAHEWGGGGGPACCFDVEMGARACNVSWYEHYFSRQHSAAGLRKRTQAELQPARRHTAQLRARACWACWGLACVRATALRQEHVLAHAVALDAPAAAHLAPCAAGWRAWHAGSPPGPPAGTPAIERHARPAPQLRARCPAARRCQAELVSSTRTT